jgi:hypothetical protein
MPVLSEAEEVLLTRFHELGGDRKGAEVGQMLLHDDVQAREDESVGIDFEGAIDRLIGHRLIERRDDGYALTQEGYDYLYASRNALR